MSYTTDEIVRTFTGLTEDDISQVDLSYVRDYADREILQQLTIRVYDEELESDLDGSYIDGSNKVFYTKEKPIADTDYDKNIDTGEITVYTWSDSTDESTKQEVTVSSVDARSGKIELSSAPARSIDKVTIDYSYYKGRIPNWDLVSLATAYLAGHLAMIKIKGKVPERVRVGRFATVEELPGGQFYREYIKILNQMRTRIADVRDRTAGYFTTEMST